MVYQAARAVKIPIIGLGGISTSEDALEFFYRRRSGCASGHSEFLRSGRFGSHCARPARLLPEKAASPFRPCRLAEGAVAFSFGRSADLQSLPRAKRKGKQMQA